MKSPLVTLALLALVVGCNRTSPTTTDANGEKAAAVYLTVPTLTPAYGAIQSATVVVADSLGNVIEAPPLVWRSSNPYVISIATTDKKVSAVGFGMSTLSVTCQGITSSITLTVLENPPLTITVPSAVSVEAGSDVSVTPLVRNSSNVSVTSSTDLVWESSNPAVATVTGDAHKIHGVAKGTAVVTIRADGGSATVLVTVFDNHVTSLVLTPPLDSIAVGVETALGVKAYSADGVEVPPGALVWKSSDTLTFSVDFAGRVRAFRIGSATISVQKGNVTTSIVLRSRAFGIGIFTTGYAIAFGDSVHLSAHLTDSYGDSIPGAVLPMVTWSSNRPDLIRVSADGWAVGVHLLHPQESAYSIVTATSGLRTAGVNLGLSPVVAGLPLTLRFYNGTTDIGSILFKANKGGELTLAPLSLGTLSITSGNISVDVVGTIAAKFPLQNLSDILDASEHVTLYAVGSTDWWSLFPFYDDPLTIAGTTSEFRIIMGSSYFPSWIGPSIFVVPHGGALTTLPDTYDFELGGSTYVDRVPGGYDIVVADPTIYPPVAGNPGKEIARFPVTLGGGEIGTYIITGNGPNDLKLTRVPNP